MKYDYDPETDSLYIKVSPQVSTDSEEVFDGIVFDYNADGKVVGIDIEDASKRFEIHELTGRKVSAVINSDKIPTLVESP